MQLAKRWIYGRNPPLRRAHFTCKGDSPACSAQVRTDLHDGLGSRSVFRPLACIVPGPIRWSGPALATGSARPDRDDQVARRRYCQVRSMLVAQGVRRHRRGRDLFDRVLHCADQVITNGTRASRRGAPRGESPPSSRSRPPGRRPE